MWCVSTYIMEHTLMLKCHEFLSIDFEGDTIIEPYQTTSLDKHIRGFQGGGGNW